MKHEISAGGIVFRRNGEVKILLIKDSYGRWALPKGLIEKDESSEDAALREIREETGLKELKIIELLGEVKYFYKLKTDRRTKGASSDYEGIFKIVKFFLVEAVDEKLKISWEIKDAKWFKTDEALNKIEYKNTKDIMEKAVRILKKKSLRDF